MDQRQIVNRPRPGELAIFESGLVARGGRNVRPREDQSSNVEQECCGDGALREARFNSAIAEHYDGTIFLDAFPTKKRGNTAKKILMKTIPANFQLWFDCARQQHTDVVRFRLPQQIKWIDVMFGRGGVRRPWPGWTEKIDGIRFRLPRHVLPS